MLTQYQRQTRKQFLHRIHRLLLLHWQRTDSTNSHPIAQNKNVRLHQRSQRLLPRTTRKVHLLSFRRYLLLVSEDEHSKDLERRQIQGLIVVITIPPVGDRLTSSLRLQLALVRTRILVL